MVIQATQENIRKAREQLEQQKQQVQQQLKPKPTTQQELRQATPTSQIKRRLQEEGLEQQKKQFLEQFKKKEQEIQAVEGKLKAYLKTPAGKLAYAKEMGLTPAGYERHRPYYNYAKKNIPYYETPYGRVLDYEKLQEFKQKAYETERKVAKMGGVTALGMGRLQKFVSKTIDIPQSELTPIQMASLVKGKVLGIGDKTIQLKDKNLLLTEKSTIQQPQETPDPKLSNFIDSTTGERLTRTEMFARGLDPNTGKAILTVTETPSEWQRYKEKIGRGKEDKSGTVAGGTITYLAEKAGLLYEKSQQRQVGKPGFQYYQVEPTRKLIQGTVQIAPYVTPIAPVLLTTIGIEHIATKPGRQEIKEIGLNLEQSYNIPKETAWLIPAVEIGGGILGLKSQWKQHQYSKELKAFEQTKGQFAGVRMQKGQRAVDLIKGQKTTKYASYKTDIKQPVYFVGDDESRYVLEGGKGFSYRVGKDGRITSISQDIAGRGQVYDSGRFIVTDKGVKVSYPIGDSYQLGGGRLIIKSTQVKGGKIVYGYDLITGQQSAYFKADTQLKFNLFDTSKPVITNEYKLYNIPETTKTSFVGLGTETKGGMIKFVGGKGAKIRYYPLTDKTTVIGKVESSGIMKKIVLPDDEVKFIVGGGKGSGIQSSSSSTSTIQSTQAQAQTQAIKSTVSSKNIISPYAENLVSESMKQTIIKPTDISKIAVIGSAESILTSQSTKGKQIVSPVSSEIQKVKQKQDQKIITVPKLDILSSSKFSETQKVGLTQFQIPSLKLEQKLKLKQKQKQQQRQLTATQPIQRPINPLIPLVPVAPKVILSGKSKEKLTDFKLSSAYRTWIKRKGKKIFLSGSRSKAEALKRGYRLARETLVATFGVTKSKAEVKSPLDDFKVPIGEFRRFRKRKGKRIPLIDTFIERRKFRLKQRTEKLEILKSRKKKKKIKFL